MPRPSPTSSRAVRADLDQPDLPFYFVQIGRFVTRRRPPTPWNAVQEAQRKLPDEVAEHRGRRRRSTWSSTTLIHVGTPGLKRLGQRLANVALREQFGQVGGLDARRSTASAGGRATRCRSVQVPGGVNSDPRRHEDVAEPGASAPTAHIAGFSIRKADGAEVPLIFEAARRPVARRGGPQARRQGPRRGRRSGTAGASTRIATSSTRLDMAVPVFGPIPLDAGSSLEAPPDRCPRKASATSAASRLTRHALERFVERFGVEPAEAEPTLRAALARTRRLGRNAGERRRRGARRLPGPPAGGRLPGGRPA